MERQFRSRATRALEILQPALPPTPEPGQPVPIHVRLHSHCGACGLLFEPGANITALKHHGSALIRINARQYPEPGAPTFPEFQDGPDADRRYQFCRLGSCPICGVNGESITCHSDCFNLWMRTMGNGDGLYKLWVAATWRYPWVNSPVLRLPPWDEPASYMGCATDVLEYPDLARLPLELKAAIVKFSGPTEIGRFASVLQLMSDMAADRPFVATLPLGSIKYWNRGSRPRIFHASNGEVVQLIIDARGLMEIRWVTKPMEDFTVRSDDMLYITGPIEQFSRIEVAFQNGLARLKLPFRQEIDLWDSPATLRRGTIISGDEPAHPSHLMYKMPISRFATLDLRRCNGLTFFIVPDGVHAIHAHTPESPSAVEAFERLRLYYAGPVSWFYVPLAADDEVLDIGLRLRRLAHNGTTPTFLIHLRSGHYAIGPHLEGAVFDVLLQTHGRPVLIYEPWSDIQLVPQINQIAVFPQTGIKAQYRFIPSRGARPSEPCCLSTAPLEGVESMDVFRSEANGPCVGFILTYRDGRQRSVGQCRLGLDVVSTYRKPVKLYQSFRPSNISSYTMRRGVLGTLYVDIATEEHPDVERVYPHDVDRRPTQFWAASEMQGTLKFWFQAEGSFLRIETPEEAAPEEMLEFDQEFIDGKCEVRELAKQHMDGLRLEMHGRVISF
ncbi:unnamed protein product [Clonostachys byssicola]|uniref:Uncharacterized protein n=1 Tax=Clonostachys byssicola TaxID=160290 RepID=A0A9N9UDN9_9HYPO|nr:unnamed protein product [Clonostachys byssicola]